MVSSDAFNKVVQNLREITRDSKPTKEKVERVYSCVCAFCYARRDLFEPEYRKGVQENGQFVCDRCQMHHPQPFPMYIACTCAVCGECKYITKEEWETGWQAGSSKYYCVDCRDLGAPEPPKPKPPKERRWYDTEEGQALLVVEPTPIVRVAEYKEKWWIRLLRWILKRL